MKMKRKIIEIDDERCNGCGQCVSACAEGAIELVNGKARLISENYCDGLAACLGECPEDALRIVERESEAFDPEAVEHHLLKTKSEVGSRKSDIKHGAEVRSQRSEARGKENMPCGCPSTNMQTFSSPCQAANQPAPITDSLSALTHWPIQIKLIPPGAPFLKNADILVAADCTPVAYPAFHNDFLKNKTVLMGCPKFDDTEEYINKFKDIFSVADVRSVTILIMEVPCCSKLPPIVQQGMAMAGKKVQTEIVVVSARGKILKREKLQ